MKGDSQGAVGNREIHLELPGVMPGVAPGVTR